MAGSFPAFVAVTIAMAIVGLYVASKIDDQAKKLIFCFTFGTLGFMVSQVQMWPVTLIVFFPFMILSMIACDEKRFNRLANLMFLYNVTICLSIDTEHAEAAVPIAIVMLLHNVTFLMWFLLEVIILFVPNLNPKRIIARYKGDMGDSGQETKTSLDPVKFTT
jgi:hypothetical protein